MRRGPVRRMAMKRVVPILFFCFFILPAGLYAGTVTLVTYYPPPTGAYNKILLPTQADPCGGNSANKGMLFLATNGSLNVCDKNGNAQVYPQQCYNVFSSCSPPGPTCPLLTVCVATSSPCACGYNTIGVSDTFQVDPNDLVTSIVCCGGS